MGPKNTRHRKCVQSLRIDFGSSLCCLVVVLTTIVAREATMPHSALERAKRAFVKVLVSVALAFSFTVKVNRDSDDSALLEAYRQVVKKAHPDKGGSKQKFQQLQEAKEAWAAQREKSPKAGRPEGTASDVSLCSTGHRVQSAAVLLTYFGAWSLSLWRKFLTFVRKQLLPWSVWRWCVTLEKSEAGKLHVHLALQFRKVVDRTSKFFSWKGRAPNASSHDYLGQGFNKNPRFLQASVDRGFFYVYADKEGTQRDAKGQVCVEGNHFPCWVKTAKSTYYQVPGKWPLNLWQQHKLSHETYDNYLYLCRDGVVGRKRNLDAVRQREEEAEEDKERVTTAKRVRLNTFEPFPELPAVTSWLKLFEEEVDRYPFLVVWGPSRSRKTEYAKSLFKKPLELKVGTLEHFPEGMRAFARNKYDAVVLDDCRDFRFLVQHQEKLQGKSDAKVEFASTPGGQCAFSKWLHRVPVVVTANFTTKNDKLLVDDDFLGNLDNRVLVRLAAPLGAAAGGG